MSIIKPETDINLWISIISQSIQSPEALNLSLPSLKEVFTEVIDNPVSLTSKYKISQKDFFRSILIHILNPVLQMETIQQQENIDSYQVISNLLNEFVNLSILLLSVDDSNLYEMVILLFQKNNKLYKFDNHFYNGICNSFIDLTLFALFLDFLETIPDSNENQVNKINYDEEFIIIANKIPPIVQSLISSLFCIENEPDLNWKTVLIQCMAPFLKIYRFLNEKTAFFVFCCVINEMNRHNQIDYEIMNLWVTIFELYLKTDNFSLIFFTLSATYELIKRKDYKNAIFTIFNQDSHSDIVKLYLNVSIREDFCKFLKEIYQSFLADGLIDIDDLSSLWVNQNSIHISVLPSLLSLFVHISNVVPTNSVGKFIDLILTKNSLTEEWLECIVQITLILNNRKQNVSKLTEILTQISNSQFNFGDLKKNEIESLKKIADVALPQLLMKSLDKTNILSFFKSIVLKINKKQETNNDIETLCKSLPNFNIVGKRIDIIQELFEKILSIFTKYNITTMKKIIEILTSKNYICTFNEQLLRQLLLYANDDLSSEIYSFVSDLSLQKCQIPIDLLLSVMIDSNLEINSSFYITIKQIVLKLNDGGKIINSFPFNQENIVWYFCFLKSKQTSRFQKFISRLYMRSTISDEEMIQSFVSNSINHFKRLYFQQNIDQNTKNEIIDLFSNCLCIFLNKFESLLYIPYNYHFSEYKTNKITIQLNEEKQSNNDFQIIFPYDQRRTVSSLIRYIQIKNKISNDIILKFQNKILNEKNSIEEEIGTDNLCHIKNNNQNIFLTFLKQKTSTIRPNRTCLPSLYIVNNIKGLSDILFKSDCYPNLFYKLPTFNETLTKIQNLKSEDFQSFFPYNDPIKFQYNFESYLDFYSSNGKEFSLLEDENFDDSYHEAFIKESGIIDYLINCGLSTSFVPLIHHILSFINDYYNKNNESVIDNEILGEQFLSLIEGFIKPDHTSRLISDIFSFRLKSLPNLSRDLLYQLLMHDYSSFRKEARNFLKDIYIPLSYYAYVYDKSNELYEEFYISMSDHIYLTKTRDDRVIEIIILNCQKKNPYPAYLYCIDAALKMNMFNQEEKEHIANYIANNFIIEQMDRLPKYCFNEAMQIASYFYHPVIIDALNKLFNQFDFSDHLKRTGNFNDILIDGDKIGFRKCSNRSDDSEVNCRSCPIGLKNLGMTCYVNSVLQQLFNINDFRNALNEEPTSKLEVATSLNRLFYALSNSYLDGADPSRFINIYGGINPNVQCDCCEFLQNLLIRLKINIFGFSLKDTITAINNDQLKVESIEKYVVLPLPVSNISSLDESLKHFFAVDFFKNYIFPNDMKFDAKKTSFFESMPDHLIIQFKRFEFNHQTQKCEKITSPCKFSTSLLIDDLCFKLTGIITHIGDSADGGHYISYIRRFHSDQWFEYNDLEVTCVREKWLLENGYKNSYLLFYTKNDSDQVRVPAFKEIKNENKYKIICRMLFSHSFCNTMVQICKNINYTNLSHFKFTIFYFFQLLPIYKNESYDSQFGCILLSKCQLDKNNNNEDFVTTILYTIFEFWSIIKMENCLLYAQSDSLRHYSCEILKLVVSQIECIEEIENMVQESKDLWLYHLYSSNQFFELINFAIEKDLPKMIQISNKNNWIALFEHLFISIIQFKKKLELDDLNLHFLIQIFIKIGFTDQFENEFCRNIDFVPLLLISKTPIDDIVSIIMKFKQKEEVKKLLNDIRPKSHGLEELISKLC